MQTAILQFGQALASGVIRGDEFNSVAENAPTAMDAFARALDVPKGKITQTCSRGKTNIRNTNTSVKTITSS